MHIESESMESFVKLKFIVDLMEDIYRECGYDREESLNAIEYEVDDYVAESGIWLEK